MMKELHSKGTRIEDIAAVLKRSPIHPRIVEAIKSAYALGLGILPHHDFTKSSHGCHHPSCLPNMCKGIVIERIQASLSMEDPKKTKIYLGDGLGDFCPSLKLGDGDYVMPRKDVPVWDLICKNRSLIKAQICEWSNGEEFKTVLLHLISRIISVEGNNTSANIDQLYSVDCN
ncbi:hypothetical protein Gotur_029732 [Gossypium turneri]